MKMANILFNVFLIVIAAFFFQETFAFPKGSDTGGIGPAFFPQTMLILVIIFAVYNLAEAIISKAREKFFEDITRVNVVTFCVVIGSMLLMIFFLGSLPFILIASVMLFIQCYFLKLKLITSVITALVLSVSVYLIFVKGFSVLL